LEDAPGLLLRLGKPLIAVAKDVISKVFRLDFDANLQYVVITCVTHCDSVRRFYPRNKATAA
jgi:hypothetical protein